MRLVDLFAFLIVSIAVVWDTLGLGPMAPHMGDDTDAHAR